MGSFCSKNLPASSVWTGYFITIAIVCAGLQASTNDMYYLLRLPQCAPGTSDTFPPPAGVPFCNRDAYRSATDRVATAIGTSSTSLVTYSVFTGNGATQISYYCIPAANSTCPLQSKMPYSSGSPQMRVRDMAYRVPSGTVCVPPAPGCTAVFRTNDDTDFMQSMMGQVPSDSGIQALNNVPVKVFAQTLPGGLSSTATYYLRVFPSGFALAASLSDPPLLNIVIPATIPTDLVIAMPAFDSCPFQSKLLSRSPQNLNADGSFKTGACGYCLSQTQATQMTATTGTAGAAVALLTLVLILSRFQFFCKMRFFKAFAIIFSVISWLFLLAAVAVGFFASINVAACSTLMSEPLPKDDISSIYAVVPNGLPKVGNYQPVAAKSIPANRFAREFTDGTANFQCSTASGVACYHDVRIFPGPGAAFYVAAIVFLLLFLIFVGIKVDFNLTTASSGNTIVTAVNIKPVVNPGRDLYL